MMSSRPGARATTHSPWECQAALRSVSRNAFKSALGCENDVFAIFLNPASTLQCGLQLRFDLFPDVLVGISCPGNVRFHIEWGAQRATTRVGHDDAEFSGDQGRTE